MTLLLAVLICSVAAVLFARWSSCARDVANAKATLKVKQAEVAGSRDKLNRVEQEWEMAFRSFSAIDVETTGLATATSKVIQIAIATFKAGRPVNVWSTYINPCVRIPPNATKLNQITDAMVRDAPKFDGVMKELQRKLQEFPLVAHNLKYDTSILIEEFSRRGIRWQPRYGHCTMRKASGYPVDDPPRERHTFYSRRYRKYITYLEKRSRAPWQKLVDAMSESGVRPSGPLHDAKHDALGCGALFVARATAAITAAHRAVDKAEQGEANAIVRLDRLRKRLDNWLIPVAKPD
jgi:DNA polymerase III epsilon subunit-like protein